MEEITLEKIDILRHRANLSYAEAKSILEKNNGNVVESLIFIEQNQKSFGQNVAEASNELVDTVKDIIKKGNVNRIKIKKDEKVLVDIPVTAGIAAGAIGMFSPALLVVGAVTAVASKVKLEIERPDGRIEVIDDIVREKVDEVREKATTTASEIKNNIMGKTDEIKEKVKDTFAHNADNNTQPSDINVQNYDINNQNDSINNQFSNENNLNTQDNNNINE